MNTPLEPPSRFPLRVERALSAPLGRLLALYALAVAVPTLLPLIDTGSSLLGEAIAPGTVLALLLAGACGVVLLWVRLRPRGVPPVRLLVDAIVAPFTRASGRAVRIPYREVDWLEVRGVRPRRRLLLAGARGSRLLLRERAFVVREDFERLLRELTERVPPLALVSIRERVAATRRGSVYAPVTWTVSLLCLAGFGAQLSMGAVDQPLEVIRLGGNAPALVARGELFRLVTANLLHGGTLHLYGNLLPLVILGARLERLLGGATLACVIGAGALCGALTSAWAGLGAVSAGASTAVFGLIAALLYLNAARARELPPELRFPLPAALLTFVLIVLSTFLVANVDHAGHAGGVAGGMAATALLVGRRSAARTLRLRRIAARLCAAALAVVLVASISVGVRQARRPLSASFVAWAEALAGETEARPELLNEVAWVLAVTPDLPEETLELARAAAQRAARLDPDSDEIRDTLATAHFRLGELERAIEIEREIAARKRTSFYWSQVARFEWAHARRSGTLRLGSRAFPMPHLERDQLFHASPEPFEAHAVALRDEEIVGFVRVIVASGSASPLPLEAPADARTELTLVDSAVPAGSETEIEFTPFDPDVAALP